MWYTYLHKTQTLKVKRDRDREEGRREEWKAGRMAGRKEEKRGGRTEGREAEQKKGRLAMDPIKHFSKTQTWQTATWRTTVVRETLIKPQGHIFT